MRTLELKLSIALHNEIKELALAANMTQGEAVVRLATLGIATYRAQKKIREEQAREYEEDYQI